MAHLEGLLKNVPADVAKLVIADSVFSMDGDIIDLPKMVALCKQYKAWLIIDEAHSVGVFGKTGTGIEEHFNLYGEIDNKMGTLSKTIPSVGGYVVDGEEKELTRGELMVYVRGHDPELRAQAYQELYRVYGQDGPVLGLIYQTLVRDWRNEQVDLRHFASPIAARNLVNDIPDDVVDTLLQVCERTTSIFQRYFRLKARLLGMDRLRRYDVYAPIAKSDKRYDFSLAAETVFDSFRHFDPRLFDLARRVFDERHLDGEVRKGKRGGAFCATVTPDLTPWVLLNYQGAWLSRDLVAGLVLSTLLVPQGMAYAELAGLPAITGLYTTVACLVAYAVLQPAR